MKLNKKQLENLKLEINNLNENELLKKLSLLGWDTTNETLESWLEFQHYEPVEIPEIKEFEFDGNLGNLTITRNGKNFDIKYMGHLLYFECN